MLLLLLLSMHKMKFYFRHISKFWFGASLLYYLLILISLNK